MNGVESRRIFSALLAILAVVFIIVLTNCNQVPPVSIEDRLSMWQSDMRNNKSNVWTEFHDDCASKNAIKNYTLTLATQFGSQTDYALSSISVVGSNVTATIAFTAAPVSAISFVMKEKEPKVWYILSLSYNGTTWN